MNKVEKYLVELSECFKGAKATGGIIQMTEVLANEIADGCDGLAKECAQCAMVAQNSTSTNTTKAEIRLLANEIENGFKGREISADTVVKKLRELSALC